MSKKSMISLALVFSFFITVFIFLKISNDHNGDTHEFPRALESYEDSHLNSIGEILVHRAKQEPFNLVVTGIFLLAIIHTLSTSWFTKKAHQWEEKYKRLKKEGKVDKESMHIGAGIFHFLGEMEAVFGVWSIIVGLAVASYYDYHTFVIYVDGLKYTEPMFIIVIMTIASSRPILKLFELIMWKIVKFLGGTLDIWWLSILIVTPLLGSFITEPAAMTIAAYLVADKLFVLRPNKKVMYGTLALLFVNISVGGVLTNFAAPPVLMVSETWNWSTPFMFMNFGWKAIIAIILSTSAYYFLLKKDLDELKEAYTIDRYRKFVQRKFLSQKDLERVFDELEEDINSKLGFTMTLGELSKEIKDNIKKNALSNLSKKEIEMYGVDAAIDEKFEDIRIEEMIRTIPGLLPEDIRPVYRDPKWDTRDDKVPVWVMLIHALFLLWTVFNAHEPILFIGGFLFYLGFFQVTAFYQNRINLKPALMVAFFIAALIIHGSLQAWWIEPVLGNLQKEMLNLTSIGLTAFNDNAAITYLSTLVTDFSDVMKYAVVTGAITGGGLTVIANAPNPVGQSILKKYFKNGISSINLLLYALLPTLITGMVFYILKF